MTKKLHNSWKKGIKCHHKKLDMIDWQQLYNDVKNGFTTKELKRKYNTISEPTIIKYLKLKYSDGYDILKQNNLKQNIRLAKKIPFEKRRIGGVKRKGKTSPLKGKTYEEIFESKELAERRKKITSNWMKTNKNIRRYCRRVSKPQQELYNKVKKKFPKAILEHPLKYKDRTIWLDIVLLNQKIDIEYDGYYWHNLNQQQGKLSDKERDIFLKNNGWKVYRVNKKNMEDFLNKLNEGDL